MPDRSSPPPEPPLSYTRKVLIAVTISVIALLLTAFVYYTAQILVLIFAGILFSVFLSAPSDLLAKYARIDRAYALGVVVLTLVILAVAGSYFMGRTVAQQAVRLSHTVPGALKQLETDLYKYMPAPKIDEDPTTQSTTQDSALSTQDSAPLTQPSTHPETSATWLADKIIQIRTYATDFLFSKSFVSGAGGIVTSTFGILGNIVIVLGIGLFFAIAPHTYSSGLVQLFPAHKRSRIAKIMQEIATQLQWWFVGQLCSMCTVGILVFIGLTILGNPLAFTLAIIAGLLNFVPYVGPLLAAVPAILIAFAPLGNSTQLNPALAGWTLALYLLIQTLDGWVFTPFYQKRAVNIPPALIILAQVIFSLLLGPIGLILATPILASVLVLIRRIYIEDILGDIAKAEASGKKLKVRS